MSDQPTPASEQPRILEEHANGLRMTRANASVTTAVKGDAFVFQVEVRPRPLRKLDGSLDHRVEKATRQQMVDALKNWLRLLGEDG